MRTTCRIRRDLRQLVLCGVFIFWCFIFLSYWNNTHVDKTYTSLELVRRRVVIPQRITPGSEFPAFDSKRGQFSAIDAYFNKTKHGFFLEIGNDVNETGSLTSILEKSRGWTGLQIVPDRDAYLKVLHMKRGAHLLQACIKLKEVEWPYNGTAETPCVSPEVVTTLMDTNKVDLLVLDFEGSEISFLSSFLLNNISVSMITVEVHDTNPPTAIISQMNKLNFECLHIMVHRVFDRTDLIFRNRNIKKT